MAKDKKSASSKKQNKLARWFKDLRGEVKKIYWPDAKSVLKNTVIVIVVVAIAAVIIYLFDFAMSSGLGAIKDFAADETTAEESTSDTATDQTSSEALESATTAAD